MELHSKSFPLNLLTQLIYYIDMSHFIYNDYKCDNNLVLFH